MSNKITFILFIVWVISLAFLKINIVSSLSVDNLLAPIVFLFWVISLVLSPKNKLTRYQVSYLYIIILYFILGMFTGVFSGGVSFIKYEFIALLKITLYFVLPILCIQTMKQLEYASRAVLLVAFIVCLSAAFDSIGLIDIAQYIDVADRTGDTRLGNSVEFGYSVGNIQRSAGLMGEFGSISLLIAFCLSSIVYTREEKLKEIGLGLPRVLYFLLLLSLVAGAIASQSRNVVLSAFIVLAYIQFSLLLGNKSNSLKPLITLIVIIFTIILLSIAITEYDQIYNVFLGEGAMKASASARINQYAWAFSILDRNVISGIGGAARLLYAEQIAAIHNLWLNNLLRVGFIGIVPLLWIFIKAIIGALRLSRVSNFKRRANGIAGFMFAIFVSINFYAAQGSLLFWFFLGLAVSYVCVGYKSNSNPSMQGKRNSFLNEPTQLKNNKQKRVLNIINK